LGLVRSLDISNKPISTAGLRIGAGPLNQTAQGRVGGGAILKGVRIYQREVKTKGGESKVGRFVMTFRTASSRQAGSGKWHHPGTQPTNLMEDGFKWALEQWTNKIAPGIISSIVSNL